jgi:hypothetical protein
MKRLVIEAWLWLWLCDILMHLAGIRALYRLLQLNENPRAVSSRGHQPIARLVDASELACVFYFKNVRCLQRSAVTTLLLRRNGWPADMVLGAQLMPLRNHAWVEVSGQIVNDKPYLLEIYQVLERR